MININQEEFEAYINEVIDGKITRVQLTEILQTDTRTLINKIYQLKDIGKEGLLQRYIEKYPYRPKEDTHINYQALVAKIIMQELTINKAIDDYDIAERTYRRNIERLEETNPTLYDIYKRYLSGQITEEDIEYVISLKNIPVSYTNNVEERKAELMDFFRQYDEFIKQGYSEQESIRQLGESPKSFKRKSDELDRILYEDKIKKEKNDFKGRIKVSDVPELDIKNMEKQNEIIEKEKGE